MLGGLGICGRPFCCSSFLSDFVQVSIKMAKEQNLSLNAAKISGACGRLMCCLRYEYDTYLAEKALTPKVGATVVTPDGEGVISDANPMTGIVKVKLCGTAEDDAPVLFVREDVVLKDKYNGEKLVRTRNPEKPKPNALAGFEVVSPFASLSDSDQPVASEVPSEGGNRQSDGKNDRRDKKKQRGRDKNENREKPDTQERSLSQASEDEAVRIEEELERNNGGDHGHGGHKNRDRRRDRDRKGGRGNDKQKNDTPSAPSDGEPAENVGHQSGGERKDRGDRHKGGKKHGGNNGNNPNNGNKSGNGNNGNTGNNGNNGRVPSENAEHNRSDRQNGQRPTSDNRGNTKQQSHDGANAPHDGDRKNGGKRHRPFYHNRKGGKPHGGNGGDNGGANA